MSARTQIKMSRVLTSTSQTQFFTCGLGVSMLCSVVTDKLRSEENGENCALQQYRARADPKE